MYTVTNADTLYLECTVREFDYLCVYENNYISFQHYVNQKKKKVQKQNDIKI